MVPLQFWPLQFGIPGSPELIVVLLVLVIPVAIGYYVYRDARRQGEDQSIAALWAVAVGGLFLVYVVPGIVGFGVYRYTHSGPPVCVSGTRVPIRPRARPPSPSRS